MDESKPDNALQKSEQEKPSFFEKIQKYLEKKYAVISHKVNLANFESSPVLTDNLKTMVSETSRTIK